MAMVMLRVVEVLTINQMRDITKGPNDRHRHMGSYRTPPAYQDAFCLFYTDEKGSKHKNDRFSISTVGSIVGIHE